MPKHISVRLPWHDRGWDGKICNKPQDNSYCTGTLACSGEMLRKYKQRNIETEIMHAGKSCKDINYIPPCSQWINTFGEEKINHIHIPPDFLIKKTTLTEDVIDPNTSGTWPYKEVADPDRTGGKNWLSFSEREKRVNAFFSDICEKPTESLAFFYLHFDNPINSENKKFLLVGAAEILEVGEQPRWAGMSAEDTAKEDIGNQVWTRWIRHTGLKAGCIFPHQALALKLANGEISQEEINNIIPEVPVKLNDHFLYVTRKFESSTALILLETLQESIKRLRSLNLDLKYNYEANLDWLNKQISKLWQDRGIYPGIGPLLEWLGHSQGVTFYKEYLRPLENSGQNPVNEFVRLMNNYKLASLEHRSKLKIASQKWAQIPESLRDKIIHFLSRLDLRTDQLEIIFCQDNSEREKHGLISAVQTILENPYVLCEELNIEQNSISFEVIDQGLCPSDASGHDRLVEPEDSDRLRAIAIEVLKAQASKGHTWMGEDDFLIALNKRSSVGRVISVDHYRLKAARDSWSPKIGYDPTVHGYYLVEIRDDEKLIAEFLSLMINADKVKKSPVAFNYWVKELGRIDSSHSKTDLEPIILGQAFACEKAYSNRISAINGSAGTGKTSAVKAVLSRIREVDKEEVIQLAFTGRAAFILEDKTGYQATTIHSFLNEHNWLWPDTWVHKRMGGKKSQVLNFVIDEASMLDVPLFAQFLRAVDWDNVRRVLFVGDMYQLPPIGPGKPYVDIISALSSKKDSKGHTALIGNLKRNVRQLGAGSQVLSLASVFRDSGSGESNEALVDLFEDERVERDLKIVHFSDQHDLMAKLQRGVLEEISNFNPELSTLPPYEAFDKWLDLYGSIELDRFQILAPFRKVAGFGIDDINLFFQRYLRGALLDRLPFYGKPNQVGELTKNDKVMINKNRDIRDGYDFNSGKSVTVSVTNGQLAYVVKPTPRDKYRGQSSLMLKVKEHPSCIFYVKKSQVGEMCELGYATTVHKAQGSEFDIVFLVLPFDAKSSVPRELIYTALTRCKSKLVIFTNGTIEQFKAASMPLNSDIRNRNTWKFLSDDFDPDFRVGHTANSGHQVISKSECLIANMLHAAGMKFDYNFELKSRTGQRTRWPDFAFNINGIAIYWEHAGMLTDPGYAIKFEAKKKWYEREGLFSQLVVSHENDGIDSGKISRVVSLLKDGNIAEASKIFDPNIYRKSTR